MIPAPPPYPITQILYSSINSEVDKVLLIKIKIKENKMIWCGHLTCLCVLQKAKYSISGVMKSYILPLMYVCSGTQMSFVVTALQ